MTAERKQFRVTRAYSRGIGKPVRKTAATNLPPSALGDALAAAGLGLCRLSPDSAGIACDPQAQALLQCDPILSKLAAARALGTAGRKTLFAAIRRGRTIGHARTLVGWPLRNGTVSRIEVGISRGAAAGELLLTVADRTAEHEELRQLRDRAEHLRYTVEFNPQMPWLAEQDKGVTAVTDRYLKLCGITEDQALGFLGWMHVVHPQDLEKMQAAVGTSMMSGKPMDIRLRFRIADGSFRWMRSQSFPRRNEAGDIIQWYGYTEDIHEIVMQEIEVRWRAEHDALTGLPNRTLFNQRLDQAIDAAGRDFARTGLMMLDLDHFKEVNDLFGHDAGDTLLKRFSEILIRQAPEGATIARLGGDEFAVLVPNMESPDALERVADNIFQDLKTPISLDWRDVDCRSSAGAAVYPIHATSASELFKHADIALYEAKKSGRGKFQIFDPAMKNAMQRRVAMVNIGREAVENKLILPYYQPQFDMMTGQLTGFEALLRRRDRNGEICLPGTIAEAFNDYEVAEAIGLEMLEQILADVVDWTARGLDYGHMAINAATAEFRNRDFMERLISKVDKAGIERSRIVIEVNEAVFMGRAAPLVGQMIAEMKQEGFGIALDDFGTGYASLTHLREIPVDSLKIDRSFIMDLFTADDSAAIVSAIITLAHSLRKTVIAEGIETPEQAEFLKRHGCSIGQGFLFGRPEPREVAMALMGEDARRRAQRA